MNKIENINSYIECCMIIKKMDIILRYSYNDIREFISIDYASYKFTFDSIIKLTKFNKHKILLVTMILQKLYKKNVKTKIASIVDNIFSMSKYLDYRLTIDDKNLTVNHLTQDLNPTNIIAIIIAITKIVSDYEEDDYIMIEDLVKHFKSIPDIKITFSYLNVMLLKDMLLDYFSYLPYSQINKNADIIMYVNMLNFNQDTERLKPILIQL